MPEDLCCSLCNVLQGRSGLDTGKILNAQALYGSTWASQADRTLVAEQGKTDFRPPEDGEPPPLDRPTDACMLVAALLSALLRMTAQHLQASNLASFDTEVWLVYQSSALL